MTTRVSRLVRLAPPARSDRDLLRAHLGGGEPGAFDELARRHAGLARRAAAEVCPPAADDVAQATLALLARKAAAVADRESAAGWVFETARRLALKARTAAARRATHEGHAHPPQQPADPLDLLTLREVRAAVAEELARLPDDTRLPLVLCYWDGADRPAAAARLGCSVSTLKRRLDAGRDQLAARLARRGFTGPAVLAALTATQAGVGLAAPVVAGAGRALAPWKTLAALVAVAGVAAAGIGLGAADSAPADPPASSKAPPSPTPAGAAPPGGAAPLTPAVDRYGDPLPAGAVARLGTIRFGHGGQLHAIAYSPDGKTIASGGPGRIMLWEAATGKPIAPLVLPAGGAARGRVGHTFRLAFTRDGRQLISVGSFSFADHDRGQLALWDVEGRRLLHAPQDPPAGGSRWMRSVAVAPDGKTGVVGRDNGELQLIDIPARSARLLTKADGGAAGLSFAPDGKTLAVATYKRVLFLDPATGEETKRFETESARQVVFAPDGKSVWVGCDGGQSFKNDNRPGTISRWDVRTGTAVQTFPTAPEMLLSLAVSPDGKTLASGGVSAGPFLWDAATGKAVDLDGPAGGRARPWVQGLAFSPDGKTLSVADTNGRVRVWDVAARRELHLRDEHANGVSAAAVSPDGKSVVTAGGDGTVRVWDLASGRAVRSWVADDTRSVFTVAYTPDGRSLLTAGWGGTVRLWDAATGRETRRFRGEDKGFGARAALSPDGRLVAASGKDGQSIVLYEAATGRPVRELTGHVSFLMGLTFSADGRRLVSAADMHAGGKERADDRSVRVWDVVTGVQLLKLDAGRPYGGLAVSPDGRVVAAGVYLEEEKTGYLRFWDTRTGREMRDRRVDAVEAAAFSPDGRYLATADRDVRLIEVASGRVAQVFESGAGQVCHLTFTPDGRQLISTHDDRTALVWDVTPRPPAGGSPVGLWDALAAADAAAARRAAAGLTADPAGAVAVLGEKLRPVPRPAGAKTTAALVADLGAPAFDVREAAGRELAGRVEADAAELSAALATTPSAEVRRRLADVLRAAPGPWPTRSAEELRQVRAVAVLEAVGTPEARRLLGALAGGDPSAPLTREAKAALRRPGG